MSSKPSSRIDEARWVTQIRGTLEEELEDDNDVPVSIFNVPKILMASDPDSYTPQEVAIGPYHYWRPEMYEMERYKLAAAKRTQKRIENRKFQEIVQQLIKHERRIRSSYNKYVDSASETLAWMMAIDASFLLEFLEVYAIRAQGVDPLNGLARLSSRMSHLLEYNGRQKSAHNAILRDLVMLENQIPLFVLRKMLEFQYSSLEKADDVLSAMLLGFCLELSPFQMITDTPPPITISECAHLLDFLYELVTPDVTIGLGDEANEIHCGDEESQTGRGDHEFNNKGSASSFGDESSVKQLLHTAWRFVSKIDKGPILRLLKKVLFSKPLKLLVKLPWAILSKLPVFRLLKTPVEMFFSQNKADAKPEDGESSSRGNVIETPPLIEEIAIPSVSELAKSGVNFCATDGNMSTIAFDTSTITFYLPSVSLDVNTEAILRNLVAYEASSASGPLVFTRYTELMNGIIDTEEDVKLLREKGIILNRLKSDEEVSNLWNGMSKSIRLTRVPFLDKVIEDVNKYHDGRWKVKMGKFMKSYVFGSWKVLTLLAAIAMLLLMGLQAFCSVYTCSRWFHQVTDQQ